MRNLHLFLTLVMAVCGVTGAQEISDWVDPLGNSIKSMLQERPPRLQGGFTDARDQWLLYSSKFDAISRAGREGLLRKYGYMPMLEDGGDWLRSSARQKPAAVSLPGVNVKVTPDGADVGSRGQSETSIAAFGDNVVVGYNDSARRASYSRDGGATWRTSRLPTFPGTTAYYGDPVVVASSDGRFYHAYLADNGAGDSVIAVARSDDGGANWGLPVNATVSFNGDFSFQDKEWLAIDNSATSPYKGTLYLTWTRFAFDENDSIRLVRSTDGGRTWSQPVTVTVLSNAEQPAEVVQLSYVATGPDGDVYVAWWDSRVDGIRMVRSGDGGHTFGDPVTALGGLGIRFSVTLPGPIETPPFPQIAVDQSSGPNRGTVYLTSIVLNDSSTTSVLLARSTDRGATWSQPVRVAQDANDTDKFHPAIAVGEGGNVALAFYDRRNDPENNSLTDLYLTVSDDGGQSFPRLQRVTTTNWQMLGAGTRPLGEYNQVFAANGKFFVSWGDNRSGQDADVYAAWLPQTANIPDFVLAGSPSFAEVVAGRNVDALFITPGVAGAALTVAIPENQLGLTYQASGNRIRFNAAAAVMPGTYLLPVTATSDGLQRSTIFRLTVHAPELTAVPAPISGARNPAFQVRAVVDELGALHTVTLRETVAGSPRRLSYQQVPAGTSLGLSSVSVFRADYTVPDQTVSHPGVGVDRNGKIYVTWSRIDSTGYITLMSSSSDGRTFSPPQYVAGNAFRPLLMVGKNGTIFVAYVGLVRSSFGSFTPTDLFLVTSRDGGATFSPPVNVSQLITPSESISTSTSPTQMTLDAQDNPHFLWYVFRSGGNRLMYRRSTDGGASFATAVPVAVPTGVTSLRQASFAVAPTGAVYVAFNVVGGTTSFADCLVVKSADGTRFEGSTNASRVSVWTGELSDWPSVAVDTKGIVTVVWRQWLLNTLKSSDTNRDVFFARSNDEGRSFASPVNLSSNLGDTTLGSIGGASPMPPAVAVDSTGRLYVLWDDDTAGSTQIWMAVLQ